MNFGSAFGSNTHGKPAERQSADIGSTNQPGKTMAPLTAKRLPVLSSNN